MHKKLCLTTGLLCGWFLCAHGFYVSNDTLRPHREPGNPYIMDPAPELQGRSPQNWFIWQSSKKIIYVSNTGHLLQYDGTTWKKTEVNRERIVSMDGDDSDTIYAATDYNFGYFKPDTARQLVFTPLLETLPAEYRENIKMKSCFVVQGGVYFIAKGYIFFRSTAGQVEIRKAKTEIIRAFKTGDDIYALQEGIGLTRISATEQIPVQGSGFLSGEGVIGIFKQDDGNLLMCTHHGKFYRYNGASFHFAFSIPSTYEINYRSYQPMVQLPDGRYAFTTRTQGIVLCDKNGRYITSIDKSSGLRNNLVNGLRVDQDGSLWAALDNGVNRIELSSPLTFLDEHAGLESAVLRITRHKGILYFGTMTGLYRHTFGRQDRAVPVQQDFNSPVWDLYSDHDLLLAATTAGLYRVTDGKMVLLTRKDHLCRSVIRSRKFKDIFYASSLTGIFVIRHIAGEKWKVIKEINFSHSYVDYLKEDAKGDVWASAYNDGFYRITLPAHEGDAYPDAEPVVHTYDLSHGVHAMYANKVFEVKGTLVFGSADRLLQYDEQQNRFVEQHIIKDNEGLIKTQVIRLKEDGNGNIYADLSFEDKNRVVIIDRNGNPVPSPFFSRLEKKTLYDIMLDEDSLVWFGGPSGVTRVDLRSLKRGSMPAFETMVRSVTLNRDSVLFGGHGPADYRIVLPYQKNNTLRFGFGAPSYDDVAENQFQYFLEGYDDDWLAWTPEARKDYTDLREGRYRIRVRAKNIYNVIGKEAILELTILPPWYRTWWAYTLYSLAALFMVWAIVQGRLRQLSQEKSVLEQIVSDRTKELASKNTQLQDQAQKLLTLDTLKSRFFANISHEFRTPLTLILGPLEQYFSSRGESKPGEAALAMMYRNSKRLHQLIDQLLYITKLEDGYTGLTVIQHDIHHFIRTTLSGFDALATQKKITYRYTVPETACPLLFDADKLEKILYNLLSNAFKFTPHNGSVTVTLACSPDGQTFTPSGDAAAQWIRITVKDSGIGISQADLPKIFDRFYQVDASDTSEFSGTGIGLALVKELVKLYGGTIDVTSKAGEGSCFTVTLPVARPALPQHEVTNNISFKAGTYPGLLPATAAYDDNDNTDEDQTLDEKITVLIAEDNVDMFRYIQSCLGERCDCIPAMNGKEGMARALELIPDLVVTDIMMPETDGLQFCHELKTDQRTSHIPVIMLTAKADQTSKMEGLKTGADDYLSKPFDVEELKIKVHNLIARRNTLQERYRKEVRIEPSGVTATSLDEAFLRNIIAIVEDNLADAAFSVELLVDKSGVSRTQLHRKLKALTGQSASDLIRSLRLKRAAQLLEKNSDIISQIGYQVGFSDQSYFAKCFRRQFGMSPSAYQGTRYEVGESTR